MTAHLINERTNTFGGEYSRKIQQISIGHLAVQKRKKLIFPINRSGTLEADPHVVNCSLKCLAESPLELSLHLSAGVVFRG